MATMLSRLPKASEVRSKARWKVRLNPWFRAALARRMQVLVSIVPSGNSAPTTTPSAPHRAAISTSASIISTSSGVYTKSPSRGRISTCFLTPGTATALRMKPSEGVRPPTTRAEQSSTLAAPPWAAATTDAISPAQISSSLSISAVILIANLQNFFECHSDTLTNLSEICANRAQSAQNPFLSTSPRLSQFYPTPLQPPHCQQKNGKIAKNATPKAQKMRNILCGTKK